MNRRFRKLLNIFAVLGMGLKLFPVAIFDELALAFYSVLGRKKIFSIPYSPIRMMICFLGLSYCVVGAIQAEGTVFINSIRQGGMFFFMLFLPTSLNKMDLNDIRFGAVLLLIMSSLTVPWNWLVGGEVASWQNGLFTGTAYAAFGIIVGQIAILNSKWGEDILALIILIIMIMFVAIYWDSRFLTVVSVPILILALVRAFFLQFTYLRRRRRRRGLSLMASVVVVPVLVVAIISNHDFVDESVRVEQGLVRTLFTHAADSDLDRKELNQFAINWIKTEGVLALFGRGVYMHQNIAPKPQNKLKARPTGVPVFIIDFGLVFCILLVFSAGIVGVQIISLVKFVSYWRAFLALYLYLIVILTPFITNTLDAVLWWWLIFPNGLLIHLLKEGIGQNFHAQSA